MLSVITLYLALSSDNLSVNDNNETKEILYKWCMEFNNVTYKYVYDLLNFKFKIIPVYHYIQAFCYDFVVTNKQLVERENLSECFYTYYKGVIFYIINYNL